MFGWINKNYEKVKPWRVQIISILSAVALVFGIYEIYNRICTPDISGEWRLTFTVNESSYKAYIGDTHGYKIFFRQSDKNVSGTGEKWEYRGKQLEYKQHTKIDFEGNLVRETFKATYILHGSARETTGILEVTISDGGKKMVGTFSGTAANTKGTVTGVKN